MVQSVARACLILEIVAAERHGSTLKEIVGQTGLLPTTVHNLLATLVASGYIKQERKRGLYSLGSKVYLLSKTYNPLKNIVNLAEPYMEQFFHEINETVVLAILEGFNLRLIRTLYSTRELAVNHYDFTGKLHCTATGKLFMAHLLKKEVDNYVAKYGLRKFTSRTIANRVDLENELKNIRKRGISVAQGEGDKGVSAVGVPILGANGKVVASMGVSLPGIRFNGSRRAKLMNGLLRYGSLISKENLRKGESE